MDSVYHHEILAECLRLALSDIGLDDDDKEIALKSLLPIALNDAEFQSKFSYAMQPANYQTRAMTDRLHVVGTVDNAVLPIMRLPVYAFKRKSKPVVNLNARLSAKTVAMFNVNYGEEFNLVYTRTVDHDHPEAAMSRKIEYDLLLKYAWENHCNPLLLPTNYDFSVIDVGGDWLSVVNRKQFGIHVCNPLLDARDCTRNNRKIARDTTGFYNTSHVCRNKFQNCDKTAPVAIALHSAYDIDPVDIVSTMARRGISNFVGSMFLPENLDTITKYSDVDYGYKILVDRPNVFLEMLDNQFSAQSSNYRVRKQTMVVYDFPSGESRSYCHALENLLKYSKAKTYSLKNGTNDTSIYFEYNIFKRVGSLIYFEFKQCFENPPANLRWATSVSPKPYDGYRVKLEPSLLSTSITRVGSPLEVYVPRGLFDTVANYCLTRTSAQDFTVEQAITYTRSVMNSVQINESILSLSPDNDSFEVMVACGLAAFHWSAERYHLLESRVPHRKFIASFIDSESSITSLVDSIINVELSKSEIRSAISRVGSSIVNDVLIDNPKLNDNLLRIVDTINRLRSPCVLELADMTLLVSPIDSVDRLEPDRRLSDLSSSIFGGIYLPPTYPDYDQTVRHSEFKHDGRRARFVESKALIDKILSERFPNLDNTLIDNSIQVNSEDLVDIEAANEDPTLPTIDLDIQEPENDTSVDHIFHKRAINDFIRLASATDEERIQTAQYVVAKAFDSDGTIPSLLSLQADLKSQPLVLSAINGEVYAIRTLTEKLNRGENTFIERLNQYQNSKFCTILPTTQDDVQKMILVTLNKTELLVNDIKINRNFDCVYLPEVQILVASLYKSLSKRILHQNYCNGAQTVCTLVNGVAGCGKTHQQVQNYIKCKMDNQQPAIFSATRAAASQALERLNYHNVTVDSHSVSTVDSFLMNKNHWRTYTHVFIDEALQLHCGKLHAILEITNPIQMTGYGDKRQITFINFSRFLEPTVDTSFKWSHEEIIATTRRIPKGPRIRWLNHPSLYGPSFITAKPNEDFISIYAQMSGLEKQISINWLYKQARLDKSEPLLILVYRADVANDLRMRLNVTRHIPDEGNEHRLAVATIGESQGEDVPHSLLLRLSTKEETLYTKDDQTIVALTRSSKSWGYLTVPSNFPSLLEKIIQEVDPTMRLIPIS